MTDINLAIARYYNNTPHCSTGVSPAELHINRKLNFLLSQVLPQSESQSPTSIHRTAKSNIDKTLTRQVRNFGGNRKIQFNVDQKVICRNYRNQPPWVNGIIVRKLSPVTYLVKVNGLGVWKRHVNQIKERLVKSGNWCDDAFDVQGHSISEIPSNASQPSLNVSVTEAECESVEPSQSSATSSAGVRRSERVRKAPNRCGFSPDRFQF